MMEFTCSSAGDRAVLVQFKQEISEETNWKVIALANHLEKNQIDGVEEWVPAYAALMVYYNPIKIGYVELVKILVELDIEESSQRKTSSIIHEIPVLYGGECGPDLQDVAAFHGLNVQDVIHIHSRSTYRVYMIGFVPGFPYLGGLDSRLHTPRLDIPRLKIPAGSVGIAGQQTGIYPLTSPGGWRIIGHTPISLFQPDDRVNPFLISAGDSIRFVPVTEEEYCLIKGNIKQ
ncbi:5-oxoprolinase subunit PxpB [Bacillus sp. Bva_UNVM-123]|uniref:5-oxoprolinase subunit PxpB n=1 Tax=Bacillus sp. Bva_UNVM-123 TaxID=2829798 RepID=UPI00391F53B9